MEGYKIGESRLQATNQKSTVSECIEPRYKKERGMDVLLLKTSYKCSDKKYSHRKF